MSKSEWMKGEGIVNMDSKVGEGTKVWHYVILFKCKIGKNCIIFLIDINIIPTRTDNIEITLKNFAFFNPRITNLLIQCLD